jgi:hypothetical protein
MIHAQKADSSFVYAQAISFDENKIIPYPGDVHTNTKSYLQYNGRELIRLKIYSSFVWKPFFCWESSASIDTFKIEKSKVDSHSFIKINQEIVKIHFIDSRTIELLYSKHKETYRSSLKTKDCNCSVSELEQLLIGNSFKLNAANKGFGRIFKFDYNNIVHISSNGINQRNAFSVLSFGGLIFLIGVDAPILIEKVDVKKIIGTEILDRFRESTVEIISYDKVPITPAKTN